MGSFLSSRWKGHTRLRCIGEGTIKLPVSALIELSNAPLGTTATFAWGDVLTLRAAIKKGRESRRSDARARQLDLSTSDDRTRLGTLGLVGYAAPYGGIRWWLSCPECEQDRSALYCLIADLGAPGSQLPFECRKCAGLAYRSQRLAPVGRLQDRARKIAARMGHGETWYLENVGSPPKPKAMHWRTWHRHNQRLDEIEARSEEIWMPQMVSILQRLEATARDYPPKNAPSNGHIRA